jgi:hypothetical protein
MSFGFDLELPAGFQDADLEMRELEASARSAAAAERARPHSEPPQREGRLCSAPTPWGQAERVIAYTPGLAFYSTPSHGGFHLGPAEEHAMKRAFPGFIPFVGWPWLEEDCDAALPALLWPDLFTADSVRSAVRMVQVPGDYFHAPRTWLLSPAGSRVREIARAFEFAHMDQWERGSLSTSGQGWRVCFTRGSEERTVNLNQYPSRRWYSTAELDALDTDRPGRLAAIARQDSDRARLEASPA